MYKLLKPLLFLLPAERAHKLTMRLLDTLCSVPLLHHLISRIFSYRHQSLERQLAGLRFANPVGLAAGFDKDGAHIRSLATLGFGFVELGTVTPRPQSGNPRPRLFRLPKDEALINRMGFNNKGVENLARNISKHKSTGLIIGGNIGKNKDTPNEDAIEDYLECMRQLHPLVDYFAINVSSPNTPGLRELQNEGFLRDLISSLQQLNGKMGGTPKPLFLKIAPDLTGSQLDAIADVAIECGLTGIIATNTTVSRQGLATPKEKLASIGEGGLSGAPLKQRAEDVLKHIASKAKGKLILIASGGIHSPEDALDRLEAGADLVQVYTGLIYEGPGLVRRINRAVKQLTVGSRQ